MVTDSMVIEALYKSIISKMGEFGTEEDKVPDGYGEFGHEITNPIPVNSIAGSRIYLNNLRTLDGNKIQFTRFGSSSAPNVAKPIDIYEITVDGKKIATLYISPYNKKNSNLAPRGFKLEGLL
jgi:hypothetical protein